MPSLPEWEEGVGGEGACPKMEKMALVGDFASRHIGPRAHDIEEMLGLLELSSLDDLVNASVPEDIRMTGRLEDGPVGMGVDEASVLSDLRAMASRNRVYRSYIGMGYSDCFTPAVILRNVLEDPRWYTPYTPYQSEISQGRLEALLNFQTMVADLTGMEIANASLLDEGTAAAEAMQMCARIHGVEAGVFFAAESCHPMTLTIVKARAEALGVDVVVGAHETFDFSGPVFGVLVQYPASDGSIYDLKPFIDRAHAAGALAVVSADFLSLALLKPPGELGADIAVGSTQRFGVPLGYGGPHAAYLATRDSLKRQMPGRIVGVSHDAEGRTAVRLAMQTREQHIRRDRATSNICTAQVLLAVVASMYAVYHGPEGILEIARRVRRLTWHLNNGLLAMGFKTGNLPVFDTIEVEIGAGHQRDVLSRADERSMNLRVLGNGSLGVSLDETTTFADLQDLIEVIGGDRAAGLTTEALSTVRVPPYPEWAIRTTPILAHTVFNTHRSETEMMRYLNRLQSKDLSLASSMIPLGSCTMKLNAAVEMLPITWPEFNRIHPFAPADQVKGYRELTGRLESILAEITGFDAVSLQPNAGSQGEYAGLLVIRKYLREQGQGARRVCLIPESAHGTNPASAVMAGMRVVVVRCDTQGNIDVDDLRRKAADHRDVLAVLMVTYPSTHGVFEAPIVEICRIIHECGGQVYMDGANMNALIGVARPGDFGPDVCHLNLHKTFCIPHGGGGPGMGPIAVKAHLAPYLPTHPIVATGGELGIDSVSQAPWGSASILPITYAYVKLMGWQGLSRATRVALLNANYIAHRLDPYYPVLYRGQNGFVAHECILDLRALRATSGVEVEDVAKRLIDYGFHAPTVSFPVPGTLMVEPTESESREEIDRFCEAMISIRGEITEIECQKAHSFDNVLKNAPHTAEHVTAADWAHPYSREKAAFPISSLRDWKYWPPVARVDNVYGDRNLICSCIG